MTHPRGRRPLTCHHEAGHAVARWWLGFHCDDVVVLTVDEVGAGVTIKGQNGDEYRYEGLASGEPIQNSLALDFLRSNLEIDREYYAKKALNRYEMALVEWSAGVYAEARYSRKSAKHCLAIGGQGDLQGAITIVKEWFPDDAACAAALGRAETIARALVRSPKGWAAVQAVAEALLDRGRIDGDAIDALCTSAYGAPFVYDRWAKCWPPTPTQIRAGFLPVREARRAA